MKNLWEKSNCYKDPAYYNYLLPKYLWRGLSDTQFLDDYLSKFLYEKVNHSLEFGAGSGRGTKILAKHSGKITAVEISPIILASFNYKPSAIQLVNEDINSFIKTNPLQDYDFIFSFWGPYPNPENIPILFDKLRTGTRGFFFHAHRGQDEQRMVREILHLYKDGSYNPLKSSSWKEDFFRTELTKRAKLGQLSFSVDEVVGEAVFHSFDFAIESFLNFHLGGVLEETSYYDSFKFLENKLKTYLTDSGEVRVPSGIKIFRFLRN